MNIAELYLNKTNFTPLISEKPPKNLGISVVIPCYNEDNIKSVLHSLLQCYPTNKAVEVIIVLNSKQSDTEIVKHKNKICEQQFFEFKKNIKPETPLFFQLIKVENISDKIAGVGYARKIGMDEALYRLNIVQNKKGIIVSLDADCIVEKNYLTEIEKIFHNKKAKAISIRFEHPISGVAFDESVYDAICQYELYLHYHILASRFAGHPFAFHTIGSAFAVRADIYAMQGGMNKRQAGEDFYFLHKVIPLGNFFELNSTRIYPSPRTSERVPFGTGATINKIINSENKNFYVYDLQAYKDLKMLFENVFKHYHQNINYNFINTLPEILQSYLYIIDFKKNMTEILSNTSKFETFKKRFFRWFDMFMLIKYLNYSHKNYYTKIPISFAAKELLDLLNIHSNSLNNKDLLIISRNLIYN